MEKTYSASAVPWWAARAACISRGMRLPEMFEWDMASRDVYNQAGSTMWWISLSEMVFGNYEFVGNNIFLAPTNETSSY